MRTHVYDKGTETRRIYQDITCDFYQVIREGQEQTQIEQVDQKLKAETRSTVAGSYERFDDFHEGKK